MNRLYEEIFMKNEIGDVIPDSDFLLPSLPDTIGVSYDQSFIPNPMTSAVVVLPPIELHALRCGCYLINYTPKNSLFVTYDGTLRVECQGISKRIASGDLYQRPVYWPPCPPPKLCLPILAKGPSPASGIPILARDQYRYYLAVTKILQGFSTANSFTLGFDMWRFTKKGVNWSDGGSWEKIGSFTSLLSWGNPPASYPSDYLEGDVKDWSGKIVGRLTMGWISEFLRKATLEIDRVSVCMLPLDNKAGVDWKSEMKEVGWDLNVKLSDTNVPDMPNGIWTYADLHQAMLKWRDATNLDSEWHYYMLCVPQIPGVFGVMYDAYAFDTNKIPREGAGIACNTVFGNDPMWGLVKNKKLGETNLYFRTAVHEEGHAMGLYHNAIDNGFMNQTVLIAQGGTSSNPFPNNVKWSFASDDQKRLRHMPDIYIRPGGLPFGTPYSTTPISDLVVSQSGLELNVSPLLETVPIGAPIRINLELVNKTDKVLQAPKNIGLRSEFIRGKVIDPSGTSRTFSPLIRCFEYEVQLLPLNPGESISDSITLLRGRHGALFPSPGLHRIIVELHWDIEGGMEIAIIGETSVLITSASDDAHAQAALKVLSTPDTALALALHGDHLKDGTKAIQNALKSDVLRPHFAYIEARRLAEQFQNRPPDIDAVAKLIDERSVMSIAEIKRAAQLIGKAKDTKSASGKNIANVLKKKAKALHANEETKKVIESL
jgi:hypothetical protein